LEFLGRLDDQVKIRGYRVELGEVEARLLSHPDVADAVVVARAKRLAAYVVFQAGMEVGEDGLRGHLADALPAYMVPSTWTVLPVLPLTSAGKVDRAALPRPGRSAVASRPAETARQRVLVELVARVLDRPVDGLGLDDNFFHLGGDSISSMQLVGRARRAGLMLTPRDVYQVRTLEELAATAVGIGDAETGEPDDGTGTVLLTPVMHWLGERHGPVDGYTQAVLLRVPGDLGLGHLTTAVQALLDRHDLLRSRLVRGHDGAMEALEVAAPGEVTAETCVVRVAVFGPDDPVIQVRAAQARAALSPERGRMLRIVWFDAGPGQQGRLLLMLHHLVIDGVSWRILLPDLHAAWQDSHAGRTAELEPVPSSFRRWAEHLQLDARGDDRLAELDGWRDLLSSPAPLLPGRHLDPERDTVGAARSLRFQLPGDQTALLLTTVPAAFHAKVDDVLLTGLVLAVAAWRAESGVLPAEYALAVDLESHGRADVAGFDLSRTVGWFTSAHPVRLDLGAVDLADLRTGGPSLGAALKLVKEQLRAVPDGGIGFGQLRYLNTETSAELAGLGGPQVGFNYLGRFVAEDGGWTPVLDSPTPGNGPEPGMAMEHVLEVTAMIAETDVGPVLDVGFTWAGALLSAASARAVAGQFQLALAALIDHAHRPDAGGHTPSDLDLVSLRQEEIDDLEALLRS
jgi:non-ribosomal peptide synthase protein (TIGR01720 family)